KEMERKLREREVREREIRRVERERAAMQAQKDRDEEEKYQLWKREQELKEMQKKREELDRLEKEAELRSHQQKSSERKQYASSFAVTPTPPRRSGWDEDYSAHSGVASSKAPSKEKEMTNHVLYAMLNLLNALDKDSLEIIGSEVAIRLKSKKL
ncbi:hypothetical protein ADUPG1_006357, partial [Aduncisulcus paluster]